jgi:hypothetical protein
MKQNYHLNFNPFDMPSKKLSGTAGLRYQIAEIQDALASANEMKSLLRSVQTLCPPNT